MQSSGAEIIHLGHNRSAKEIVDAAIEEDVQAIAITSYQGGHMEFFKYIYDLLRENASGHIKIFGGGGGTILPSEIAELQDYGISRIYSPDDGRAMGLQGMINELLEMSDFPVGNQLNGELKKLDARDHRSVARLISAVENGAPGVDEMLTLLKAKADKVGAPVIGITGTGGAGKSSVVDELVRRFLLDFPDKHISIISVDPSRRKSGGALLGDRIRMNSISNDRVYMRSLATRQANLALSPHIQSAVDILKAAAFDLIVLETSGIGQSDTEIVEHCDISLYVMTPDFGAPTQLEKIDMLDFADAVALNKFDKRGAQDALRDVRKQYLRNHQLWDVAQEDFPIVGTIASQFNDPGINNLYAILIEQINEKTESGFDTSYSRRKDESEKIHIIPPNQAEIAKRLFALALSKEAVSGKDDLLKELEVTSTDLAKKLEPDNKAFLDGWESLRARYSADEFVFKVRDKEIRIANHTESLSRNKIPKIALPRYESWGDILRWGLQENVPGSFPFTAGVYPFKREGEDPTRMFAGEGGPERTNKRFHYLSADTSATRLSTAFDSVTLYGEDPDYRPDIYGKIGNSGVSICCLDDAKKLYSGFDLAEASTSVSMTINGPAAILTAFYMNAAIDQQCEKYIHENNLLEETKAKIKALYPNGNQPTYQGDLPAGNNGLGTLLLGVTGDQVLPPGVYAKIKSETLAKVRGTVQADILKEDQAQNTCIFSTEFSLKLMGDVQSYFIDNKVRNFYSVSISGYHIAEAGANPISQVAFTLANGFTFVEYYLSRGMDINAFAPNLSFFFSNGIDPEYAVIGRVARRIWAKAMKHYYDANERSQKLKYHIQTSGRSLHAQEIAFNDIRTTLQALYAIYDNCNSLHTNAYDEAITTPTEESVRRAVAIQLIINKELGLAKNQNPLQGAFIIEELTDLVEEAILAEFDRITERGGVLGAMESMYQRGKIQDESMYYETLKHSGEFPIVGVNTFLSSQGSPTVVPKEVIRADKGEKEYQIEMLQALHRQHKPQTAEALKAIQKQATENANVFAELMETVKYCSLGQITRALYDVGGQYRRNM